MNDLDSEPAPTTPVSPNKRKFSFRFPSASYHDHDSKNERRNFSDEAQSIPDLQVCDSKTNQYQHDSAVVVHNNTTCNTESGILDQLHNHSQEVDNDATNNIVKDNLKINFGNELKLSENIYSESTENISTNCNAQNDDEEKLKSNTSITKTSTKSDSSIRVNNNDKTLKNKNTTSKFNFSTITDLASKAKACLSPKLSKKTNEPKKKLTFRGSVFNNLFAKSETKEYKLDQTAKDGEHVTITLNNYNGQLSNSSSSDADEYSFKDIDAVSSDGSGVWV